jgi:N-glycosylase/DNA lyase
LLRQNPWECLASFILSSTKQIVQIQQIVGLLCERFGERVVVPEGHEPVFAFPTFLRLAQISEAELRACKMGFRAPYLLASAKMLANHEIILENLHRCSVDEARTELLKFPGVGNKIADCVLLFAYGFPTAFPVDVWVMKALRELYFPKRRVKLNRLKKFSQSHFGPNAGYAQQYLFHYMRNRGRGKPGSL